ncbi:hypothetical protein ACFS2C_09940 [Prauserella oleivorans]|uniref:Integrase n=1 Tax=Prauserella oleivorans TaxID=1478153 RepID=A0ABW5W812_9PSEU
MTGIGIDDINIFNARLKEWQDYSYHRPHGGSTARHTMRHLASRSGLRHQVQAIIVSRTPGSIPAQR